MTEFKIKAVKREGKFQKRELSTHIPGVVYGKHADSTALLMDRISFNHIFKEAGTSNLVDLAIDDQKSFKTLIHDIQKDPISGLVNHVDFLKVNMKEKIHAEIPLTFTGDSDAVINLEGSLITPVDHIEVECLPADLPSELEIDISILDDFEKNIKVSDIKIPAGVEVLSDTEEIVAFVQAPRSEEELAELDEAVEENVDAVEVENKGEETPVEGEEVAEAEKKEAPTTN